MPIVLGRSVLADKHIKVAASCPVCHAGLEDMMHLLFTCLHAREIWRAMGPKDFINQALVGEYIVLEFLLIGRKQKSPVLGMLELQESILVI
jgi:hypothetical protein